MCEYKSASSMELDLEVERLRPDTSSVVPLAKRHRSSAVNATENTNTPVRSITSRDRQEKNLDHNQGKENQQREQYSERFCFACRRSLDRSRHFINIAGQNYRWHPECFKCDVCKHPLDRETTCHVYKDGVVCREDYAKLKQENSIKCSRCQWTIAASDWVRKAGRFVYHLACFSCDICLRQLSTGEQFTISVNDKSDARLLCRLHFAIKQLLPDTNPNRVDSSSTAQAATSIDSQTNHNEGSVALSMSQFNCSYDDHMTANQFNNGPEFEHNYLHMLASTSVNCTTQPEHLSEGELGVGERQHLELAEETQSAGGIHHAASTSTSSSNGSTSGAMGPLPSKSKRVRTTFTEDQLSILQTHFQIDSNPDGQDLERIATITGLSKRVTQVWFQNSRARQKKYLVKRKPSNALTSSLSTTAMGLTDVAELQSHFAAEQHHSVRRQHEQNLASEESSAGFQQKWLRDMSDRSDLSTTDGCIASDDLDGDSRSESEEQLVMSADSDN